MASKRNTAPHPLLTQEIAPIDRLQAALTMRFLLPVQTALFDYLYALRLEIDAVLQPLYPLVAPDKPYPLGRCLEISQAAQDVLRQRVKNPQTKIEKTLHAFIKAGGIIRPIWGDLRGQFFQNATQMGSLYVDVANDTVTPTKPKVEILPLAEAGMRNIQDLEHFARIAKQYWGADVYANHACPQLAPLFPMMAAFPKGQIRLLSSADYMTGLMMRDRFVMAQAWVERMPPPSALLDRMAEHLPVDLRSPVHLAQADAAMAACLEARARNYHHDIKWRNHCLERVNALNNKLLFNKTD
jgi:hypothetical protein